MGYVATLDGLHRHSKVGYVATLVGYVATLIEIDVHACSKMWNGCVWFRIGQTAQASSQDGGGGTQEAARQSLTTLFFPLWDV